jgi:hypothetical protein
LSFFLEPSVQPQVLLASAVHLEPALAVLVHFLFGAQISNGPSAPSAAHRHSLLLAEAPVESLQYAFLLHLSAASSDATEMSQNLFSAHSVLAPHMHLLAFFVVPSLTAQLANESTQVRTPAIVIVHVFPLPSGLEVTSVFEPSGLVVVATFLHASLPEA